MAELPTYKNLEEKRIFFSNGEKESFIINSKRGLDKWFNELQDEEITKSKIDATAFIYRGMTEAKHKLLTSSQRLWISNEMSQWAKKPILNSLAN